MKILSELEWEQYIEVKDAEIERMQREQIKLFSAYDALEQKLIGAKAEIDRLKKELQELRDEIEAAGEP